MEPFAIAIVGGLIGGTVAAVITGLFGLRQQGQEHQHQRAMATETRLQERRQRAYEQILTVAIHAETITSRIEPLVGPTVDPPGRLADDTAARLSALATIHGSQPVRDAVDAFNRAGAKFDEAVDNYRQGRTRLEGSQLTAAREPMEAARVALGETVRLLGDRMRADLQGERPTRPPR